MHRIVAVDVFHAPVHVYEVQSATNVTSVELTMDAMDTTNIPNNVNSSIPVNTAS